MKFEEMGLSKQLLDSLAEMKFTAPTPIQEQAIPMLLRGEDLIGQAQTGTGKTAAFGLPLLEHWLARKKEPQQPGAAQQAGMHPHSAHQAAEQHQQAMQPQMPGQYSTQTVPIRPRAGTYSAMHQGQHNARVQPVLQNARGYFGNQRGIATPSALILVPTRELAVQVHLTLQKMAGNTGAHIVAIYGGIEMRKQLRMFNLPVDVIVGTPGRTLDHMRQGTIRINGVRTVVLDEADRMLDMGFIRDVVKILDGMPNNRQTLLFSATMPREIAQIAHKYMRNPKTIKVSEDSLTVDGVRQLYVRSSSGQRLGMLLAALRVEKPFLSLVFTRTKHDAKKLAQQLRLNGIKADALHGNLNQKARERAMDSFRSGRTDVMVATDLASRGIDVPGITHVFNYELPPDPMTYVHRIGRTARAGAKGTAISMINGEPRYAIGGIERATGSKITELILTPDKAIMPPKEERHSDNASRTNPKGFGTGSNNGHIGHRDGRRPQHAREGGAAQHSGAYRDGKMHGKGDYGMPSHERGSSGAARNEGHSGARGNYGAPSHERGSPHEGRAPHANREGGSSGAPTHAGQGNRRFWEKREEGAEHHSGGMGRKNGPHHHSSHRRQ